MNLRLSGYTYARILLKLGCLSPAEVSSLRAALADRAKAHQRAHDKTLAGSLWGRERALVELSADIEAVWVRTPPPAPVNPDGQSAGADGRAGSGAAESRNLRAKASPRYEETIARATADDPDSGLPVLALLLQRSGEGMESTALNLWFWQLQAFLEVRRAATGARPLASLIRVLACRGSSHLRDESLSTDC